MPYSSRAEAEAALSTKSKQKQPMTEMKKSITYSATDNQLLLDVETDTTEGSVKTAAVGEIEIANTGKNTAFAILAYRLWTDSTTMSANTYHVNYLLKPNENLIVPASPAVIP